MATKVLKFGKHTMKHRAASLAGRFAVADLLAFGSEKFTFDQAVTMIASGRWPDEVVVCQEYEYWDKDSLVKRLYELKAGYIAFADALLAERED